MDFELAKTIAAFGGLGLGVVNLGLVLYKDFLRKGNLEIQVEKAEACRRGGGDYDFQVNFSLTARGGDIYLRSARIRNPTPIFGQSNPKPQLHLFSLVQHSNRDLILLNPDDFSAEVERRFQSATPVRDLLVKAGEHRSFTAADRFTSERLPDQWLEVPTEGWELVIEHAGGEVAVPFVFEVPRSQDGPAFVRRWNA